MKKLLIAVLITMTLVACQQPMTPEDQVGAAKANFYTWATSTKVQYVPGSVSATPDSDKPDSKGYGMCTVDYRLLNEEGKNSGKSDSVECPCGDTKVTGYCKKKQGAAQ